MSLSVSRLLSCFLGGGGGGGGVYPTEVNLVGRN